MEEIEKIKATIEKLESGLKNPVVPESIKSGMKTQLDKLKIKLAELESEAAKAVEEAAKAEEKAKEELAAAKAEGDKKAIAEAKSDLKDAKEEKKEAEKEVKEVEKVAAKADKVSDLAIERIRKTDKENAELEKEEKAATGKTTHGGAGRGQGRKRMINKTEKPKGTHGGKRPNAGAKKKASSHTKMVKPTGAKVTVIPMKKRTKKTAKVAIEKPKSVRAFGQKIEYKNDADFCKKLVVALKERKVASNKDGKRRKTKPVFGIITASIKTAVSKALHSVSEKNIEKNPREFLAKAQKLEKSAVHFLGNFKNILGSDFKKSEIAAEFGELDKSIKQFVAKITKK